MALGNKLIESYTPYVRFNKGMKTKLPMALSGSAATFSADAGMTINASTAIAAGGSTNGLVIGQSGPGVYTGSGAPTISAAQGSLYLRTDGSSVSTRAYINSDGGTTWVAVTTAS